MAVLHAAGKRVNGYRIVKLLGLGGEGAAYEAKDKRGDTVVLKQNNFLISDPGCATDLKRTERLATLRGKSNPYVATLLDQFHYGDFVYEVWQYIHGVPLAERLATERRLPEAEVLAIARDALRGLQWLHEELFIVHRDIKPDNMMIPKSKGGPATVLIDPGIALHLKLSRLTGRGMVGTPLYMAPESLLGGEMAVDGRSDLYSLGVVMYELLAGAHPYDGDSPDKLVHRMLHETPPPLKGVSRATGAFIRDLMRVEPDKRPPSARLALRLLKDTEAGHYTLSAESVIPAGKKPARGATGSSTRSSTPRGTRPASRRERKSLPATPSKGIIKIMNGPHTGKSIAIPPEGVTVGRGLLNPADRCLSRFHARLTRVGDGLGIVDLKSLNGIVCEESRRRRIRVRSGESFCLGATTLVYEE